MKIMQYNRKVYTRLLFLFLPLIYTSLGTMWSVYASQVPFIDWTQLLFSVLGITFMYVDALRGRKFKLFNLLAVLNIIIVSSTIFFYFIKNIPTAHSFLDVGHSVLWIAVLYLFYKTAYKYDNIIDYSKYIAFFIPLYTYVFFNVRMFLLFEAEETALISTAYYSLFLLPFALLINKEYLKWPLLLFVFVSILLSGKRAGFIAFFAAIFVYLYHYIERSKSNKSKIQVILLILVVIGGLSLFMFYFIQANELSIFDRLSTISEDGGSDRDVVYLHTWKMITNSDLMGLIFGHGFNTVYHDSTLALSAHTDILEVIYDYGVIGFFVYILFILKIFFKYRVIKVYTPQYASAYAASLLLFIILSLFAHLVIYPTHFLFLCAFWGMVIGNCEKVKITRAWEAKLV